MDNYTIPNPDIILITPWGQSRWGFYGAGAYPTMWFDGVTEQVGSMATVPATYDLILGHINDQLDPPSDQTDVTIDLFSLPVTGQPRQYNHYAIVGVEPTGTAKTVTIHMVQVLDHYPPIPGQDYWRHCVMDGEEFENITINPGEQVIVTYFREFDDASWNQQADIGIACFVQEQAASAPAQVHQAAQMHWPPNLAPDCNNNDVFDLLDIINGTSLDCNANDIPDECEPDCNLNGIPDDCDLAAGTSEDCNDNDLPDECDIDAGTSFDCNANDVPDECDLAAGTSDDCDQNAVLDECECIEDLSLDGDITILDLELGLPSWGPSSGYDLNLNCDDRVDMVDYILHMLLWGTSCGTLD